MMISNAALTTSAVTTTDALDLVEACLGGAGGSGQAYRQATILLKEFIQQERWDESAAILRRVVTPSLDYTTAGSLHRLMARIEEYQDIAKRRVKIAILGSSTTHQLAQFLRLHLFAGGVSSDIHEADYGVFRQEIWDPDSELYRFRPEVVILATSRRDLGGLPGLGEDRAAVESRIEAELADWMKLWGTAHDRLNCQIIQNNFESPPWRTLGNHESRHPASVSRYIARMNLGLQDEAPPYVTIHDVDHLAASRGRWQWSDERYYYHAKLSCSPENLVDYSHSLATLVLARLGVVRKCLVLDLDNTLWGGVIGDDGLGGIRLGQGDPDGEAFVAFQQYVKQLRERGVLLAVCSKNTDATAREVFEKHPEMVLRLDDISCFVANWDDKATNIGRIAEQLNIGVDSLVFVDDNPAERAIVRRLRPEVAVPELPEDPAGYIAALDRHRYFQTLGLTAEDLKRADYYKADAARQAAESTSEDLAGFLASLAMTARIEPIGPANLERSVQLINRSNQFNLTTKRYAAAELQGFIADASWITRTVSLADRFGDHGLISVLLARIDGDVLHIDTWLMSCRVLKRGVEGFLLNHVVDIARELGLGAVRGEYRPTAKNGLVRDHYHNLGFSPIDADDTGHGSWMLSLHDRWSPLPTPIKETPRDDHDSR